MKPSWETEELSEFRKQVRRFVAAEVTPHEPRWAKQQHVDRDTWRKAGSLGLLLPDRPVEYGGSGGTFAHLAVVVEELAAAGDTAFATGVHAIVAGYIQNQGTEEQKKRYLPELATGEMVGAIAMTEPGTAATCRPCARAPSAAATTG